MSVFPSFPLYKGYKVFNLNITKEIGIRCTVHYVSQSKNAVSNGGREANGDTSSVVAKK